MDLPDRLDRVRVDGDVVGYSLTVFIRDDRVQAELSSLRKPDGPKTSWKRVIERWSIPRSRTDQAPEVVGPLVLSWLTDQLDLNGWPDGL